MRTWKTPLVGKSQGSVERNPKHDLAVHKVLFHASNLPDRHVFLLPDSADIVRELPYRKPLVVRDRLAESLVEIYAVHEFTVDVELDMEGCPVSDTNWSASAITFQVAQFDLWYICPAPLELDQYRDQASD